MWKDYKNARVTPKDYWDVYVDLLEYPLFGCDIWGKKVEPASRRFYGSGHTWYEIVKDTWGDDREERVSGWMSSTLHDVWWDWYKEQPPERKK